MVPVGIFLEVLSTNKSLVLTKFGQDDNLDLDLVRSGVLNLDLNLVFSTRVQRRNRSMQASTPAWTHGMAADSLVLKLQGCFLFTKVQRYWYNGVSPPSLARPCITAVFRISQQLMR
jgi:hypothetical protein